MRLFICYDQQGNITSAIKVNVMAEGLEHPFGYVPENETVLEVTPMPELETIASHEICDRFIVDIDSKKIHPKK